MKPWQKCLNRNYRTQAMPQCQHMCILDVFHNRCLPSVCLFSCMPHLIFLFWTKLEIHNCQELGLDFFGNSSVWGSGSQGSRRGGSRAAATSKMECFVIIVNCSKPLTIITKRSILDVAAVLDPPLRQLLLWQGCTMLRVKVPSETCFKNIGNIS